MSGGFVPTRTTKESTPECQRKRRRRDKSDTFPDIWICEDHNEALSPIQRLLGSKRIPFNNLALVHFDGHPDLLLPKDLLADDVFCKDRFTSDSVDIAEWILPLVYAGHIRTIVWIKPYWCCQIDDGTYSFHVGKHRASGKMRVDSNLPYFVDELLFCPTSELVEAKPVDLFVCTLGSPWCARSPCQRPDGSSTDPSSACHVKSFTHVGGCNKDIQQALKKSSGILLDVCLDFFSTANPFREDISPAFFTTLDTLYRCHSASSPKFCESVPRSEIPEAVDADRDALMIRVASARVSFLDEMTRMYTAAAVHSRNSGISSGIVGSIRTATTTRTASASGVVAVGSNSADLVLPRPSSRASQPGDTVDTRAHQEDVGIHQKDIGIHQEDLDAYVRATPSRVRQCTASPTQRDQTLRTVAHHLTALASSAPAGTTINPARLATIGSTTDLPHRSSSPHDIAVLLAGVQAWLQAHWPTDTSALSDTNEYPDVSHVGAGSCCSADHGLCNVTSAQKADSFSRVRIYNGGTACTNNSTEGNITSNSASGTRTMTGGSSTSGHGLPMVWPGCITIARSADDGYTPLECVDALQKNVVDSIVNRMLWKHSATLPTENFHSSHVQYVRDCVN